MIRVRAFKWGILWCFISRSIKVPQLEGLDFPFYLIKTYILRSFVIQYLTWMLLLMELTIQVGSCYFHIDYKMCKKLDFGNISKSNSRNWSPFLFSYQDCQDCIYRYSRKRRDTERSMYVCTSSIYWKGAWGRKPKAPWRRKAAYSSSNAWKLEEEAKGAGFDDSSFGVSKIVNN